MKLSQQAQQALITATEKLNLTYLESGRYTNIGTSFYGVTPEGLKVEVQIYIESDSGLFEDQAMDSNFDLKLEE